MEKYLFDIENVERRLIETLNIINSSKINNILLTNHINQKLIFNPIFEEKKIIEENIIITAINIRMILDRFCKANRKLVFPYNTVGEFVESSKHEVLDLKEACNKIIHCLQYEILSEDNVLLSEIKIYGEKGNKQWHVKLDGIKYIINGLFLLKEYDEDWALSAIKPTANN